MSGIPPSARIGRPVSGSKAPISRLGATSVDCFGHVTPLSDDRITPIVSPRCFSEFLFRKNSSKMSTSVPFGSTAIWLPIVPLNSLRS